MWSIRLPRARSWGAPRVGRELPATAGPSHHGGDEERAPRHCQRHARGPQRGEFPSHAVDRGHRRHKGRPRTIGQLCCSIARKGVLYLRRCRTAGDDRPRSRPAVLRGPSAARPRRSPPLIRAPHVAGGIWHHHGRERGPAALAGRAEARGSEKERAAQQARGLRDLRRRLILPPTGAPAYAESSKQPTKHIPSRPEGL